MKLASLSARMRRAILLMICAVPVSLALDAPAVPCEVLINEMLAAPARDWNGDGAISSRDDEWIEIFNSGPASVDLAGYFLTDADSTVRIALVGMLAPGGRQLIFGLDAVNWQRDNGRTIAGLSLNNTGDVVRLFRAMGTDTVMVDAYGYKAHEAGSDRASGRRPDGGAWSLLDGLNPYTGSLEPPATGCLPTPGVPNVCTPTPARRTTWGALKAIYR